jgi:hypothetical protein
MGWCAISFCDDIWKLVKKEIPKEKYQSIAKKIYLRFEQEDMDDCCGESEIEKAANINQDFDDD